MNHTPIQFPGLGLAFNPDRVALTVFGHNIYWYGVIIATGFMLAVLYTYKRAKFYGIRQDDFLDMLMFAVPISIVCSRLYYVIFNFSLYQYEADGVTKIDWGAIIRTRDGGLAIYGAIIGAVLTAVIFCRVKKIKFGALADLGSFGLLIGQAVGRWGNFVNREAFGALTDLPWRMGLVPLGGTYMEVHPTFLYESLWNVLGFLFLATLSKKRKFDGQVFLMYIAWYGFGRGLIEGLRTDSLYFFSTGLRVSQVLGFASCAVALALLAYNLSVKKHTPEEMAVNRATAEPGIKEPDGGKPIDAGASEKNAAGEVIGDASPAEEKNTEEPANVGDTCEENRNKGE